MASEVTMMKNASNLCDIINPQVMGDMISAKIDAQLKITPYAKVDTTLVGVAGDTKTVPSWNFIGSAVDIAEGGEIETSKLTASSTTFTIKKAMKSVAITQEAVNSGLGNPIGQAEIQLAKAIAVKVDNDVLDAAYTATTVVDGTAAVVGYAGIVDANAKFEDEEDGIDRVMFIHPNQEASLLKDSDFLSADKFVGGVAVNGAIGKIAGAWIKKSKKVRLVNYEKDNSATGATVVTITADNLDEYKKKVALDTTLAVGDKVKPITNAANQYYINPILKMEPDSAETEYTEDELAAITIFLKKDIQTDHEWMPKKQQHDITVAKYYGVAKTNDAKIVLAKFKK